MFIRDIVCTLFLVLLNHFTVHVQYCDYCDHGIVTSAMMMYDVLSKIRRGTGQFGDSDSYAQRSIMNVRAQVHCLQCRHIADKCYQFRLL